MKCDQDALTQKRRFWTLQKCSTTKHCENDCSKIGLRIRDEKLETTEFIRSTAILILMTDGEAANCEPAPSPRGGHWSQSFVGAGVKYGSQARRLEPQASVRATESLLKATVQSDLGKLITYGVATNVEVESKYKGSNSYALFIKIEGPGGRFEFDLSGQQSSNGFLWQ
jgi:phage gp46-like protein